MACYVIQHEKLGQMFLCGDLGPQCRCGDLAEYLCDFPVSDEITCDCDMCSKCANEIAPDLHYCKAHHQKWNEFVKSGGVKEHLENVVPFKNEVSNG